MKALALFLFAVPFAHADSAPRIEYVSKWPDVVQEYCRSNFPAIGECRAEPTSLARMYLPEGMGKRLEADMQDAYKAGYFQDIALEDFFHGHFIHQGPAGNFENPGDYFANVSAILFHSAENNGRWREEAARGIPLEARTIRSFVDNRWQALVPAVQLVHTEMKSYESSGTVYSGEFVASQPSLSSLPYGVYGAGAPLSVKICDADGCDLCKPEKMFMIVKVPEGRFVSPRGERFDAYNRCVFDGN